MRNDSVSINWSVNQASKGCITAPMNSVVFQRTSSTSASGPTTAPPSTVALPHRNLVMESSTMSAPRAIGRCRAAVAVVLSTINGTSWAWTASATAAMSATKSVGLLGVSIHTRRVRSSISRAQASGSAGCSTKRNATPHRSGKMVAACLYPSPKVLRVVTTLSPGRASVKIRLNSACDPDAAVTHASPPSREASRFSNTAVVGVCVRP